MGALNSKEAAETLARRVYDQEYKRVDDINVMLPLLHKRKRSDCEEEEEKEKEGKKKSDDASGRPLKKLKPSTVGYFSNEIWEKIISHCGKQELFVLRFVCHDFYSVIKRQDISFVTFAVYFTAQGNREHTEWVLSLMPYFLRTEVWMPLTCFAMLCVSLYYGNKESAESIYSVLFAGRTHVLDGPSASKSNDNFQNFQHISVSAFYRLFSFAAFAETSECLRWLMSKHIIVDMVNRKSTKIWKHIRNISDSTYYAKHGSRGFFFDCNCGVCKIPSAEIEKYICVHPAKPRKINAEVIGTLLEFTTPNPTNSDIISVISDCLDVDFFMGFIESLGERETPSFLRKYGNLRDTSLIMGNYRFPHAIQENEDDIRLAMLTTAEKVFAILPNEEALTIAIARNLIKTFTYIYRYQPLGTISINTAINEKRWNIVEKILEIDDFEKTELEKDQIKKIVIDGTERALELLLSKKGIFTTDYIQTLFNKTIRYKCINAARTLMRVTGVKPTNQTGRKAVQSFSAKGLEFLKSVGFDMNSKEFMKRALSTHERNPQKPLVWLINNTTCKLPSSYGIDTDLIDFEMYGLLKTIIDSGRIKPKELANKLMHQGCVQIEPLYWAFERGYYSKAIHLAVGQIIQPGCWELLKKMIPTYPELIWGTNDYRKVIEHGNLEDFTWATQQGCNIIGAFNGPARTDPLGPHQTISFAGDYKREVHTHNALSYAIKFGKKDIRDKLFNDGIELNGTVFIEAVLVAQKPEDLRYKASRNDTTVELEFMNSDEVLFIKRLISYGCPCNAGACAAAASNGNIVMLKWLRKQGAPWNDEVCEAAINNEHPEIFKWARKNGAHCSIITGIRALEKGYL